MTFVKSVLGSLGTPSYATRWNLDTLQPKSRGGLLEEEGKDSPYPARMCSLRLRPKSTTCGHKSHRTVPLWPQLGQILRSYLGGRDAPTGRLLFPSYRTGSERMLTDIRKLLDRVTDRAGTVYLMDHGGRRKAVLGEIRTKVFRHTYITARLQTLDHGEPVSPWTVARKVGHSGTGMIERVYGHLGDVRHRASVVEYRVSQHRRVLRGRLQLVA